MKTYRTLKLIRGLATMVSGFAVFTGATHAAPFLYSQGDLILAFRQSANASDYVVNIGRATNYNARPPGTTVVVTNLSAAQLLATFPSANGLQWSVAGANRYPALDPNFPEFTLWAGAPRLDPGVQSDAWLRKRPSNQGSASSKIDVIGQYAAAYSSGQPTGPANTATGVAIPTGSIYAFTPVIGAGGNYLANFQGNLENTTAEDFDGDPGNVSRIDLYELLPGAIGVTENTPGRYLGYFELKPDGSLTFNTIAPAPPRPTITGITRSGNVATVSFTTVASATYRLRYTNSVGLASPVSTWPTGATISGTGAVLSLSDTNAAAIRFFAVDAQ